MSYEEEIERQREYDREQQYYEMQRQREMDAVAYQYWEHRQHELAIAEVVTIMNNLLGRIVHHE